ncbi:MAG: hypothetical protein CMH65_02770 [Nevskiales bacterium]|nr:hypothetical protein [Nevskiales bacterium]
MDTPGGLRVTRSPKPLMAIPPSGVFLWTGPRETGRFLNMLGESTVYHRLAGLLASLFVVSAWGGGFIVDGDGDGVPFELDECPYTRPGQPVNIMGCSDLPDADEDGIPDVDDRCPVSPPGARTDPEGCSIDSDGDGVPDGIDQCPNTAISTVPDRRGCSAPQRLAGGAPEVIVGRPVTDTQMPRPATRVEPASTVAQRSAEAAQPATPQAAAMGAPVSRGRSGQTPAGQPDVALAATQAQPPTSSRSVSQSSAPLTVQAAVDRALWGYEVERASGP